MKNKKGFTLIELLAVIVILAVIALIATPIILNMINDARKGASVDSAYGYIEAVEYNNSMSMLDSKKYPKIEDGEDIDITTISDKVKLKGTRPTSGKITIQKGKITKAILCINNYKVDYDGNIVTNVAEDSNCKGNNSSSDTDKNYGDIIYYNPVEGKICENYKEENSNTGIKNGCMKWYYIGKTNNKENYILDHNTSSNISWYSGDTKDATSALENDTSTWKSELNPRLISADEVATIVGANSDNAIKWSSTKPYGMDIETQSYYYYLDGNGNSYNPSFDENGNMINDGWLFVSSSKPSDTKKSKYSFLYDYTNCENRGCNIVDKTTNGYWTSSKIAETEDNYWVVDYMGTVNSVFSGQSSYGIRPVITIDN